MSVPPARAATRAGHDELAVNCNDLSRAVSDRFILVLKLYSPSH